MEPRFVWSLVGTLRAALALQGPSTSTHTEHRLLKWDDQDILPCGWNPSAHCNIGWCMVRFWLKCHRMYGGSNVCLRIRARRIKGRPGSVSSVVGNPFSLIGAFPPFAPTAAIESACSNVRKVFACSHVPFLACSLYPAFAGINCG